MARTLGAKSDKLVADMIRVAVNESNEVNGKKIKRVRLMADKLIEMALDGDIQAIREIGNRLDGLPRQDVNASGGFTIHISKDDANL